MGILFQGQVTADRVSPTVINSPTHLCPTNRLPKITRAKDTTVPTKIFKDTMQIWKLLASLDGRDIIDNGK